MNKFWKFIPPGRRRSHLSIGENSGFKTLCGIRFVGFPKKAKTITLLEGDECPKCAEASEFKWRPLKALARVGAVKFGIYTGPGHATKRGKAVRPRSK